VQVELRDAVFAQRGEQDPAEVVYHGVLEHHRGQMVGGVARDAVGGDAVTHTGAGDVKEMMGRHRVFAFLSAALTRKSEHSRVVAHLSVVIFISLRTAASAEAPWALIKLDPRLRARGG